MVLCTTADGFSECSVYVVRICLHIARVHIYVRAQMNAHREASRGNLVFALSLHTSFCSDRFSHGIWSSLFAD